MADESKESSKPSWKRKKAAASPPAAAKRAEASRHEWTKKRDRPADEIQLPRSRALWVILAGAGFAACILGLVVLILMIQPPKPAAVVFVGADYATNLAVPHNVAGRKGIEGIQALSRIPRSFTLFNSPWLRPVQDAPRILERKEHWGELIKEVEKEVDNGKIREQTIVFVVALHGMTDSKEAYLLPNLANKPEHRLPLKDVIASLGSEKLAGKNKVLILEGAQIPSDWRLGMLQNDFARELEDLEPEIEKVDKLWVLSGCDVDQRCWTSEGLGTTVFSHFLAEALRGKATGSDGRLYLDELHRYLAKNVKDWVFGARGAIQKPVLLPRVRGGASGEDAPPRPGAERVFLASAITSADSEKPLSAEPPRRDSLRKAWKNFRRLDSLTPHPSVYSPVRWRLYRSALVRCEELIQAGDTVGSQSLLGLLESWDTDLVGERILKLVKSGENTLAMNAVQGGRVGETTTLPDFNRFWEADEPDQRTKIWKKIQEEAASTSGGGDAQPGLSVRARADLLLLNLASRPVQMVMNLNRAADRLLVTRGEDYPQPAEAHFLRMIKLYLPFAERPSEAQTLITQAITLRQQAERAAVGIVGNETASDYPYSEQILPWIGPLVEKADADRRIGEDRLFASEPQATKEAKEAFSRAKSQYQAIALRSFAVRNALAARDRALADLPDYSRWLAHRHPKDITNKLADEIQQLWGQVHDLSGQCEKPSEAGSTDVLAKLAKDGVLAGLARVAKQFKDQQREDDADRLPEDWEAAVAAAAVPFSDGDDLAIRESIWARLDYIQKKDVELASKLTPVSDSVTNQEENLQHRRTRSLLEARMALAVIGQPWYDDDRFDTASPGKIAKDSESLAAAKTAKDPRETLAEIGQRVGDRIREIGKALDDLIANEEPLKDWKGASDRLPEADRLCRRLDVHTPLPSNDSLVLRASSMLRKLRCHDLLVWMAERTWLDHWYGEDPQARENPYYRVVGSRFIQDAADLFPQSSKTKQTQEILNSKNSLGFEETKPIIFTSELSRSVDFRLVETGKVPEGVPVVKPEPGPGLEIQENERGGYRMVHRRPGEGADQTITFNISSRQLRQSASDPKRLAPQTDRTTFGVRGFFRGQVFDRPTPVEIDPLPEIAIEGPGVPNPPEASMAVRADQEIVKQFGEGNGSVAIVLDCSGSMVEQGASKFKEAKRSLISVLKQLPPRTMLSICIFGQAAEGFDKNNVRQDPDVLQYERPELTIRMLREAAPWDRNELDGLSKSLDALIPFHGTPLVQAMWKAKLELDKATKGLKTMLVLSDGKDRRFSENRAFNPTNMTIPEFIRQYFKDTGIAINMVFFKVGEKEGQEAREQFEDAITHLDPEGHYFSAEDEQRLLSMLERSIKQKLTCRIIGPDGKAADVLDVTSPGEVNRWATKGLKTGSYTLKVQADKVYEGAVDLEQGDRLIVRLVPDGSGGIGFERALYSDDFISRKDSGDAGGWRYSALRSRYEEKDPIGPVQLFTILEPIGNGGSTRVRQTPPRFAWFELASQGVQGEGEFAVRWHELGAYPATVWRGDVPRWIPSAAGNGPANPAIKAWWLAGQEADQAVSPSPFTFNRAQDVKDREVRFEDGTAAIVESIRLEPHRLRTRVDLEPTEVNCLVIRMRHPRDRPIFVDPRRLPGITPSGFEHRFYLRADAYTGLFGPITQTEVDNLRGLSLIPVAKLKALAEGRKQVAELKLDPPRVNEKLPEPPEAILEP
ncbi:MAG: hypothetical protein ABS79_01560 [Planctomycetes bacterium SCN 63-9]|nr:MAG: hypothetical protein ABS79_01560 [Planctomycetes bacterium SCN 63-9]